jgi:hypothetical protein
LTTLVADDGTVLSVDPSTGDVTSATDSSGAAVAVTPPGGGSLTQAFANLVTWGVQGVINTSLPPASLPRPGVVPTPAPSVAAQATAALASPTVKLAILGIAAFFLIKKFA